MRCQVELGYGASVLASSRRQWTEKSKAFSPYFLLYHPSSPLHPEYGMEAQFSGVEDQAHLHLT